MSLWIKEKNIHYAFGRCGEQLERIIWKQNGKSKREKSRGARKRRKTQIIGAVEYENDSKTKAIFLCVYMEFQNSIKCKLRENRTYFARIFAHIQRHNTAT